MSKAWWICDERKIALGPRRAPQTPGSADKILSGRRRGWIDSCRAGEDEALAREPGWGRIIDNP